MGTITQNEIKSLLIKILFGMCGYFIVRYLYEWTYARYESSTVFWVGVIGIIFFAWKLKIRLPYSLSGK